MSPVHDELEPVHACISHVLLLFVRVVMLQLADKQMNRGRRGGGGGGGEGGGGGKETEYRKLLMQGALSTVPLSAAPPK